MYHARIKLVYKYSEARLMMQSLSPLDLLGIVRMQGGTFIQTYHTTNIICTKQQSNLFTSWVFVDSLGSFDVSRAWLNVGSPHALSCSEPFCVLGNAMNVFVTVGLLDLWIQKLKIGIGMYKDECQWFSGKIQRCHRWAPGSIPGWRTDSVSATSGQVSAT